jgi:hypothetical protein
MSLADRCLRPSRCARVRASIRFPSFEMTPLKIGTEAGGFNNFFVNDESAELTGVLMVKG